MSNPPTASVDNGPAGPPPAATPAAPGQIGLKSGTKLGKYEIVGRLGVGGMALVYKGYDPLLDRFVAIKQIASHLAADPKFMDRFRKEAQILAKLGADQGSVVQIYELIEDPRGLFIVMEYVEGQTLDMLILRQKGPLPVQLALEVLWHLAVGLKAVHEKGIIHRDIKPANVLVGVNHRCKIMDFGVAARFGGRTSMTLGTTKYMAPELFGGEDVDGRVDIYSLGCIVYEMLCGPDKFNQIFHEVVKDDRAEALRWMKWHTNRELMAPMLNQINPQVPEVLAKIVVKMMAKDPAKRFASAVHVLEVLKRHFTQQGHAKKAAGRKGQAEAAAAAAAFAAASAERRPEPIPDRSADADGVSRAGPGPGAAAGVVVGRPIESAVAGRGAGTTRLPRRKLTRRRRLIVLGGLVGVIVVGVIVLFTWRHIGELRTLNAAARQYYEAAGLIKDDPFETVPVVKADPDKARQLLTALARDPVLSQTPKGRLAPSLILWIDGQQARQLADELAHQCWPTQPRLAAYADLTDDELHKAAAEAWKKADACNLRIDADQMLPAAKIASFKKELEYDEKFTMKVDESLAKMKDGLDKLDDGELNDAETLLKEAKPINKNEDLTKLFDYRLHVKDQIAYRRLVNSAVEAEARSLQPGGAALIDDAAKLYKQAQESWQMLQRRLVVNAGTFSRQAQALNPTSDPSDMQVNAALDRLRSRQNLDALAAKAGKLWDEADKDHAKLGECKQAYLDWKKAVEGHLAQVQGHADLKSADEGTLAKIDDAVKRLDAMDNFDRCKKAADAGLLDLAKDYGAKAVELNPKLKPAVDAILAGIQQKADYAAAMKLARESLQNGNLELAQKALDQARGFPNADKAEIDKMVDQIRQAWFDRYMGQANKAYAIRDWASAKDLYGKARSKAKPDDSGTLDGLDQKVEEIQAWEQADGMLGDGDAWLKQGQFEKARDQFVALKKYAQSLRGAGGAAAPAAPPARGRPRPAGPGPAPAAPARMLTKVSVQVAKDIEAVADSRIKDVDYARFLFEGKGQMELQRWDEAMSWLNMAAKEKSTPEVKALIDQVDKEIKKVNPSGAAGNGPAGGGTGG